MYLVLDIGGSSLKYKIFNTKRAIIFGDAIRYGKMINDQEIIDIVIMLFNQLKTKYTIKKIAISSLGIVDGKTGRISGLGGIKNYNNVNWKTIFKKYKLPVFIENDANCAALYELSLVSTIKNAIVLVVGTGLGGALIINGKLYKGSHNGGGEVGIGLSDFHNKQYINISETSSTYAAVREYFKLTNKKINGKQLFSLYKKDKYATKAIDSMIFHLSKTLINIALLIDPEYVFIGGGISKDKLFMDLINKQVTHLMRLSQLPKTFQIKKCHDSNDANIKGALTLIK